TPRGQRARARAARRSSSSALSPLSAPSAASQAPSPHKPARSASSCASASTARQASRTASASSPGSLGGAPLPAAAGTAATAATARLARPRLVDLERAPAEGVAVERLHRRVGILLVHLDEPEAARLPGLAVVDERAGMDAPVLLEQLADLVLGGAERKVAHVQPLHRVPLSTVIR